MSPGSRTLLVFFSLWIQNSARSKSSLLSFEPPQIDGFPVDNICQIFLQNTPKPAITSIAAASRTMAKRTSTETKTKKQVVKSPDKSPPAAGGPVINQHSQNVLSLITQLLARNRGHASTFIAGGAQRHHYIRSKSKKRESWKAVSSSSEDSSDES
ncbi:unnamed protein product [Ophioblennius macclurei]